jgi:4-amino-4-deoxy-L-arabinose transferase-like glycosyltransferase
VLPGAPATRVSKAEWATAVAVIGLAAALRFAWIGAGVPAAVASDEPFVMERAFAMMVTGNFNPQVFDYPSFYMYMQTALASLRFVVGAFQGKWYLLSHVTASDFYVWGRSLTALLGTLTVVVVWRVGRRLSPTAGLLAAAFLAVQPQHVRDSHVVLTDVPMTFFVALTMLASIRACETRRLTALALAGAAAGLAAATKYTGGIALVMPVVAAVWTSWDAAGRARAAGTAVAASAVAFLVGAPYTVLDLPAFLNGFGYLAKAHASGAPPATPAWWTYLLHLDINLGFLLLCASLLGLGVGLVQAFRAEAPTRVVWAISVVFSVVFFAQVSGQTIVYGRYLLPMIPPLLVLAAGALDLAAARWGPAIRSDSWRRLVMAVVVLAVMTPPALRTGTLLSAMSKTTSNEIAYDWIIEHVPTGSRVVVEAEGMKLPNRFDARNVQRLIDHSYQDYLNEGADYLVASSLASRGAMAGTGTDGLAYRDLFQHMQLVFAVSPTRENPGSAIRVYRLMPQVP